MVLCHIMFYFLAAPGSLTLAISSVKKPDQYAKSTPTPDERTFPASTIVEFSCIGDVGFPITRNITWYKKESTQPSFREYNPSKPEDISLPEPIFDSTNCVNTARSILRYEVLGNETYGMEFLCEIITNSKTSRSSTIKIYAGKSNGIIYNV